MNYLWDKPASCSRLHFQFLSFWIYFTLIELRKPFFISDTVYYMSVSLVATEWVARPWNKSNWVLWIRSRLISAGFRQFVRCYIQMYYSAVPWPRERWACTFRLSVCMSLCLYDCLFLSCCFQPSFKTHASVLIRVFYFKLKLHSFIESLFVRSIIINSFYRYYFSSIH